MVTNPKEYMTKYAKEHYDKYRGTPQAKKKRAARNKAHKLMNPPKGKEVHHKDGNPLNNSPKNISVVSKLFNERH